MSAAKPLAAPAASGPDSLDSMTRDGATSATTQPAQDSGQTMSIGGAVIRTASSLALVLAAAFGVLRYLKKRGYGGQEPSSGGLGMTRQTQGAVKPAFGISPIAQLALTQFAKAPPAEQPAPPAVNKLIAANPASRAINDLEVIGSQPLPGSNSTLYKIRVGDRLLLLAGTPGGALTTLSEWDIETRLETEQQFEELLNQMAGPGAIFEPEHVSPETTLRSATQRLSLAAERLSGIGSDSKAS